MQTYHVFATLAVIIGIVIQYVFQSTIFGGFLALTYLTLLGYGYGQLFPKLPRLQASFFGAYVASAVIITIGAVVYRIYQLDSITLSTLLVLALLPVHFLKHKPFTINPAPFPRLAGILWFISALLTIALTYILATSGTTNAIRSPWQIVPDIYWPTLFVFWVVWIAGILKIPTKSPWYALPAFLSLGFFVIYSVASLIYQLGYGFDPFIHQATQALIAELGVVYPKPWYYLGQYSTIALIHHLTAFPLILIDRWLLPLMSAIVLPLTLGYVAQKQFSTSSAGALTAATILLVPLSFLIATTPQGLANLAFIILILIAWSSPHKLIILTLLAITTAIIHPVAGIPALLLVALIYAGRFRHSTLIRTALTTISIPIIPALFWWQNNQHSSDITPFALPPISNTWQWLYTANRFDLVFDTIYLWHWNSWLIFITIALVGIFISYRRSTLTQYSPFLLLAVYLIANWLLLSNTINFAFLIAYERAIFAERFLTLSALAMLPFFFIGIHAALRRILSHTSAMHRQFIMLTFALLATITVYVTYPRFDAYQYDRGYSTSSADISAINTIHDDAGEQEYVVLANQATSAAALRELGFYKYYNRVDQPTGEQIFFYPIPTGGSLYQIYLAMVYDAPTREVAEKAMELTGVDTVYFVLNDYWFNSEEIADIAKTHADESWQVEKDIWVFKFSKK